GGPLTTAEKGAIEFDGFKYYVTPEANRRCLAMRSDTVTSDSVISNTTVETTLISAVISANELAVGSSFRLYVDGFYSTANSSDTFTLNCKINGTTVVSTTTTVATVTNTHFELEFRGSCRATGA